VQRIRYDRVGERGLGAMLALLRKLKAFFDPARNHAGEQIGFRKLLSKCNPIQ